MKLYYAKDSCALAPHIALEEANAHYSAIAVDLAAGQQRSSDYLKINSKGRVPSLITDQGVLTETPAILNYIARLHPAATLIPIGDPYSLALADSFNSYLCSTVHVAHAHGARGERWVNDESTFAAMKAKVPETMTASFELIQSELFRGPWVLGSQYSVCDAYLFTICRWLAWDNVNLSDFPRIATHFETMSARPAVQRVMLLHA
ncbi:glutathione S-transferase [Chromatiales bacterium (ex Bugula neritina AB1)]|nr:glutathione S-transferase [Chromatiales bacterium (ex Bugula neritina AB1)]